MKIAIISDSHDNVKNLEKFLALAKEKDIEALIHAGDISAPSVLDRTIAPNFSGPVHIICGNVGDPDLLETVARKYPHISYYGETGQFEIDGKKIALAHEPKNGEMYIGANYFDLVVYGHTHKPEIKKQGKTTIINPGTLGGLWNSPTFAIYDTSTGKAEIKKL